MSNGDKVMQQKKSISWKLTTLASVMGLLLSTSTFAKTPIAASENVICETTCLVLLGVSAGRKTYRGSDQKGISSAVAVGSDVYIVDFGRGWIDNFHKAGLAAPGKADDSSGGLQSLRAGFITHLHSDHTVGLPYLLTLASDGLPKRINKPFQLYGPGSGGKEVKWNPLVPENKRAALINPDNPSASTTEMVEYIYKAYSADLNDNIADSGKPNPHSYIGVHDIVLPKEVQASAKNPTPRMKPFEIYKDDKITVTATLVSHPPVYPAYAFRFDTKDGSIVFSGDTNKQDNLIELAKGADILAHEVISVDWVDSLFPSPRSEEQNAKADHLIKSHTTAKEAAEVATEAGVKALVLTHLAPPTLSDMDWLKDTKSFNGIVVVGKPLMNISLPLE